MEIRRSCPFRALRGVGLPQGAGGLEKIGISDAGLEDARAMMAQLFESYWSKCERGLVDEVLQHPRIQELMG
ncbi:MAG: hypothetical protein A2Y65_06720 [Deltaproteobacteria bacterium RBG_13_52_11]|nr:MAG: hypothetical protein A2Y65_06720 [Deltaproteobacteria bacterium RBG_13_52_11]